MASPYELPHDFLSNQGPEIKKQTINFRKTDLPEYEGYYACILDGVLSADECANLIRAAKAQANEEWRQATIKSVSACRKLISNQGLAVASSGIMGSY